MKELSFSIRVILFVLAITTVSLGQTDTSVTITSDGKMGIGISNPTSRLHVAGLAQFDKVGPEGRLILRSINRNDPGRMGIRFLNNQIVPFEGDDKGDMTFAFFSGWGWTREYDAAIEIHGKSVTSWGRYLRLSHNGTDGLVSTDVGDIIISPAKGNGNVGIGVSDPVTKLEVDDIIRVSGNSWPGKGTGMEFAYTPGLHQGYIQVYDRDAKLWGNLYLGNGNVGIGDLRPASKLTVNGTIHTKLGGLKFPDGTVQTTAVVGSGASSGLWNQVTVNAELISDFSDKAMITISPPAIDGYFVLTFSGVASNFEKPKKTNIDVYLNDTANNSSHYDGYVGFWQHANGGQTQQIPLHATRIIGNSDGNEKTFYLNAGDNYNGGYILSGMFMVQWFPGTRQD